MTSPPCTTTLTPQLRRNPALARSNILGSNLTNVKAPEESEEIQNVFRRVAPDTKIRMRLYILLITLKELLIAVGNVASEAVRCMQYYMLSPSPFTARSAGKKLSRLSSARISTLNSEAAPVSHA
ncbi:hypothetical protein R3P38DRAFT_2767156 [Favolaschia claudopus]|uniref:Uncharacterized protein n=1 Tax=Favolaschia claudopus TaxID=2862362 RepID=A0AAW0CXN8_9AGAR